MFEPPEAARAASKYNGKALAMATKVLTQLVDDTDGSEADQTVRFGLDGTQYEARSFHVTVKSRRRSA